MTKRQKVGTGAELALAMGLPVAAMAQESCTTYTVRAGDTLGSIANVAYGS